MQRWIQNESLSMDRVSSEFMNKQKCRIHENV